jgi:heme exporter protein B
VIRALRALLVRELKLATRVGGGAMLGVVFFLVLVTLVPFAVGPERPLLARIGPAMLWLGALLATLLGLDRLFQADHEDGSLDLLALSPVPLELVFATKVLAHWLATGLPLVVAAPLLGTMLDIPVAGLGSTALTLLVGTPALTLLGAIGAALTVSLRRGGLLVPILILPLAAPVLIFGVAASNAALGGPVPMASPLKILAGLTLAYMAIAPIAGAAALRAARE